MSGFERAVLEGFCNLGCLWPEDEGGGALLRDSHLEGRVKCDYYERDRAWKRLVELRNGIVGRVRIHPAAITTVRDA